MKYGHTRNSDEHCILFSAGNDIQYDLYAGWCLGWPSMYARKHRSVHSSWIRACVLNEVGEMQYGAIDS
jgi:hypothetical protein